MEATDDKDLDDVVIPRMRRKPMRPRMRIRTLAAGQSRSILRLVSMVR